MMWIRLLIITVWAAALLVTAMSLQLIKDARLVNATTKYFGKNRRSTVENKNQ